MNSEFNGNTGKRAQKNAKKISTENKKSKHIFSLQQSLKLAGFPQTNVEIK